MTLPHSTDDLPKRLTEPARWVGNRAAALAVFVGGLLAVLTPLVDVVPGEYHGQVAAALAAAGAVTAAVARVAAGLIRGRVVPFNPELAEQYRKAAR